MHVIFIYVCPTTASSQAEVIEVQVGGEKRKVVMAPCDQIKSDHDSVTYKAGYDTGPANPLPQDERWARRL